MSLIRTQVKIYKIKTITLSFFIKTLIATVLLLPIQLHASDNTAADRSNHRTVFSGGNYLYNIKHYDWRCAIDEDREVVCWDESQQFTGKRPILNYVGISDARALSMTGILMCATTGTGKVFCQSGMCQTCTPVPMTEISDAVSYLIFDGVNPITHTIGTVYPEVTARKHLAPLKR
jgi:hypothetical protein